MVKVIMNDQVFEQKGFYISTDKDLLDFELIFSFLDQESYWAKGIAKEKVKTSIQESMCFGLYHERTQVGFARVITDKSTFAYLADVFIVKAYRKQGLSKWLVQTILAHPELQGLRRWLLATADAHELYKKFGFELLPQPDRWLQIHSPYQSKHHE